MEVEWIVKLMDTGLDVEEVSIAEKVITALRDQMSDDHLLQAIIVAITAHRRMREDGLESPFPRIGETDPD